MSGPRLWHLFGLWLFSLLNKKRPRAFAHLYTGLAIHAFLNPMKLIRAARLLGEHNSPLRFRKQPVTSTARTVLQRARISRASHFTAPVCQQAFAMPPFTLWAARFIRVTGDCRTHDGCHATRSRNLTGVSSTRGTVVQCWCSIPQQYQIPPFSAASMFPPGDKSSPVSPSTKREWPNVPAVRRSALQTDPTSFCAS